MHPNSAAASISPRFDGVDERAENDIAAESVDIAPEAGQQLNHVGERAQNFIENALAMDPNSAVVSIGPQLNYVGDLAENVTAPNMMAPNTIVASIASPLNYVIVTAQNNANGHGISSPSGMATVNAPMHLMPNTSAMNLAHQLAIAQARLSVYESYFLNAAIKSEIKGGIKEELNQPSTSSGQPPSTNSVIEISDEEDESFNPTVHSTVIKEEPQKKWKHHCDDDKRRRY